MVSLEKLISFIIFGLFVFSPLVPGWHSVVLSQWYGIYVYWLLLIILCASAQWLSRDQPHRDQVYDP